MDKQSGKKLFETFPPPSLADWMSVASSEIGGVNPLEKLQWKSGDISFLPLYTNHDLASRVASPFYISNDFRSRAWYNLPEVIVSDEKSANEVALEHLNHEADGVIFRMTSANHDLNTLLKGIAWEHCVVSFLSETVEAADSLSKYVSSLPYKEKLRGAFFSPQPPSNFVSLESFHSYGIMIDGFTADQELAEALLKGVHAIESVTKTIGIESAFRRIAFQLTIGSDLLMEVAKLKALRVLWGQVAAAYGLSGYNTNDLFIHAYSKPWINSSFQPHGNMLSGTVAAIAAISGGCNAITIVPEDGEQKMMRRIARNVSHILLEESYLGKVNDPFAGSYAIETMVNELGSKAWKNFQQSI